MKRFLIYMALSLAALSASAQAYVSIREYDCPEANQGVAADDSHFYAIGNNVIAKYRKDNGERVAIWKESNPELIRHFDGGIIIDGLLYCSHSNYPEIPMASSIEVFDPETLSHVKTISLGIDTGSCTWIVRGENCWYVCFAHYDNNGVKAEGKVLDDASWTQLVRYDDSWHRTQAWIMPKDLIEQIRPNSLSGGLYIDGRFYCTGHDATKLFVLEFPPYGMRLQLCGTIDIPFHGQGIALDPQGQLWGIDRKSRKVIMASISNTPAL